MPDAVILEWRESTPAGYVRWFLRGVGRNGSFYGEFESAGAEACRQASLEGQLPEHALQELASLIEQVRNAAAEEGPCDGAVEWTGLLAEGAVPQAVILFRDAPGAETWSHGARAFLEIVELLRPYLEAAVRSAVEGLSLLPGPQQPWRSE